MVRLYVEFLDPGTGESLTESRLNRGPFVLERAAEGAFQQVWLVSAMAAGRWPGVKEGMTPVQKYARLALALLSIRLPDALALRALAETGGTMGEPEEHQVFTVEDVQAGLRQAFGEMYSGDQAMSQALLDAVFVEFEKLAPTCSVSLQVTKVEFPLAAKRVGGAEKGQAGLQGSLIAAIMEQLRILRAYSCPLSDTGRRAVQQIGERLLAMDQRAISESLAVLQAPPRNWFRDYFEGMERRQIRELFTHNFHVVNLTQGCSIHCDICLLSSRPPVRRMPSPWGEEVADERNAALEEVKTLQYFWPYFNGDPLHDYWDALYRRNAYHGIKSFRGRFRLMGSGLSLAPYSEEAAILIFGDDELMGRLGVEVTLAPDSLWVRGIGLPAYIERMRRLIEISDGGNKLLNIIQRPIETQGEYYERFKGIVDAVLEGFPAARQKLDNRQGMLWCGRARNFRGSHFIDPDLIKGDGRSSRVILDPIGTVWQLDPEHYGFSWKVLRLHPAVEELFPVVRDVPTPEELMKDAGRRLHMVFNHEEAVRIVEFLRARSCPSGLPGQIVSTLIFPVSTPPLAKVAFQVASAELPLTVNRVGGTVNDPERNRRLIRNQALNTIIHSSLEKAVTDKYGVVLGSVNLRHITGNLWTGAIEDREKYANEFDAVLNVAEGNTDPDFSYSFAYKKVGLNEFAVQPIKKLEEATSWLQEQLGAGKRVLIHCEFGQYRSILVAFVWFYVSSLHLNYVQAVDEFGRLIGGIGLGSWNSFMDQWETVGLLYGEGRPLMTMFRLPPLTERRMAEMAKEKSFLDRMRQQGCVELFEGEQPYWWRALKALPSMGTTLGQVIGDGWWYDPERFTNLLDWSGALKEGVHAVINGEIVTVSRFARENWHRMPVPIGSVVEMKIIADNKSRSVLPRTRNGLAIVHVQPDDLPPEVNRVGGAVYDPDRQKAIFRQAVEAAKSGEAWLENPLRTHDPANAEYLLELARREHKLAERIRLMIRIGRDGITVPDLAGWEERVKAFLREMLEHWIMWIRDGRLVFIPVVRRK
jgi:hypothetical protein